MEIVYVIYDFRYFLFFLKKFIQVVYDIYDFAIFFKTYESRTSRSRLKHFLFLLVLIAFRKWDTSVKGQHVV